MRPYVSIVLMASVALCAGRASAADPVSWGASNPAKGCVIFRESEKLDVTSGDLDTRTTATTHFTLEVLSADGYSLPKTSWPDDQSTMDQLQQMAIQDRVHFVKIRDPYSPEDLSAAQSLCRQAMTPAAEPAPGA